MGYPHDLFRTFLSTLWVFSSSVSSSEIRRLKVAIISAGVLLDDRTSSDEDEDPTCEEGSAAGPIATRKPRV